MRQLPLRVRSAPLNRCHVDSLVPNNSPLLASSWRGLIRDIGIVAGCGVVYFCLALLALAFFATHESPAAIWLSTGFLVATVIIFPKRLWPGILIAAFLAGTIGNYLTGKPLVLSLGLGVMDAVEGILSGILLSAFLGSSIKFSRLRDLTGLVFLSAVLGNGLSALGGAGFFSLLAGSPFWYSCRLWWLSNAIGILTVTPLLVSWANARDLTAWKRGNSLVRAVEAILLLIVLLALSVSVFGSLSGESMSLPYLVFPVLIWAALRFGVPGASTAAMVVSVVAVFYTDHGCGPFAITSRAAAESLLHVQSFIAAALACSLVPATVIAERKGAEERLRRSESRLGIAQEIAGVGSFVLDPQGHQSKWSEQTFRIMGRDRDAKEPSFREFIMWVHPDDRENVQSGHDEMFANGKPLELDFRYICPDGSWKYIHAIARLEKDQATKQTIAFGTVMDMTDRRRIEEQLRQAQKMEAVGRLAGGVAHDFNNLLGVILGYTELALGELSEDHPLRSKIEPISKAAGRAATLTSQLLAFSRRQVLRPEELDLNRVVTDLEPMLHRLIGEEIHIVADLQTPLPMVKADPGQMDQVIMNLAVNSRDAMPNGGELRIRTTRFSCRKTPGGYSGKIAPGEYVMLTVSDTGHGMDAATRTHIFEPFFTTKEKGKGTGLGLATVYGIVVQSNGHIWAESEVGKGTDIHIVLPMVKSKKKLTSTVAHEQPSAQPRKETILLVEDEEPLRELIHRLVASMGCTVIDALTGEDALNIAREDANIDVLLTDVVMPKMDGFELASKVSAIRPEIKVLYMSGYSDELISRHSQNGVPPAFIQKPFKPSELRKKLEELLDTPQGAKK